MKISALRELIREMINEELELESHASDDAKRQGLTYMRFGRWGKNGKVTHTTQGGKLVPIANMNPTAAKKATYAHRSSVNTPKTPDAQRQKNRPEPERDAKYNTFGKTGTTAGNKIATKVIRKFWDSDEKLVGKYGYHQNIPSDEFTTQTGIPKKAAVWTAQNNIDYEQPFSYDSETDTFQIHDPMDI